MKRSPSGTRYLVSRLRTAQPIVEYLQKTSGGFGKNENFRISYVTIFDIEMCTSVHLYII